LPRRYHALDDPVERAAVQNLLGSFRSHPGDVGVPERRAAAPGFGHLLSRPFAEVRKRVRADSELDEMKRHGAMLAERPAPMERANELAPRNLQQVLAALFGALASCSAASL
jgi:hypothetical protein